MPCFKLLLSLLVFKTPLSLSLLSPSVIPPGHRHHRSKPHTHAILGGSPIPAIAAIPAQSHHGVHWLSARHSHTAGKPGSPKVMLAEMGKHKQTKDINEPKT